MSQDHKSDLRCCDSNNGANESTQVAPASKTTSAESTKQHCGCCCHPEPQKAATFGWDWWFDSPVSLFTGLLFVVSAFQAVFIWLSFKESQTASVAANKSANALMAAERAYVFVKAFAPVELRTPDALVAGWQCIVVWENSGNTPTKDLTTWISWDVFDKPIDDNFTFPDNKREASESSGIGFIGPRAQMNVNTFTVSVQDAVELMMERKFLYIWGWVEYNDIFPGTPRHKTEFCNRVIGSPVANNPNPAFIEFRYHRAHNKAT